MGLLSFFKRDSAAASGKAAPTADTADSAQQARTRARQRLIGAVVLVAAGVVGFPLLFESQPRPLPGDLPIEIARSGAPSATPNAARSGPAPSSPAARPAVPAPTGVITESAADVGREVPAPPAPITASAPAAAVTPDPAPRPAPRPDIKPEAKPAPKPADGGRAQALLDAKPSDTKPATAADGRFIVQVGAYAEAAAAREARQKVEKLGLKTYTQVVETSSGKRIRVRVGPFASRGDADKAADRIKSTGLTSAVFTL